MSRRKQAGFTILEALISSILFFMAISIAVMSFMAGSQNFTGSRDSIAACHNSYNILELITSELREAYPSTISITASNTSISFKKYHNPTGEIQTVTWKLDSSAHTVIRQYTVGAVAKPSAAFGENVMALQFNSDTRPVGAYSLGKITVYINVKSNVTSPGNVRRNIVELTKEIFIRQNQPTDATVTFN